MDTVGDYENVRTQKISESDDEDSGSYFLQPASSPYNIQEKVKEANAALLNENCSQNKLCKVKFSDELVNYEPELSDENLSSIESEDNIDYLHLDNDTNLLENQLQAALILNVCNTDDEDEVEEIVEEVYDEIPPCEEFVTFKQISELQTKSEDIRKDDETNTKNLETNSSKCKKKLHSPKDISCKKHCIERFEGDFNISVTKINLQQKYLECPPLKLQKRNCCEKNTNKTSQKLPCYGGLRSEYGLTATQLENRDRLKQIIKLREQERQKIFEENKKRRMEQNELIFSDWLSCVRKRKNSSKKPNQRVLGTPLKPTVITFPSNPVHTRPKTSYDISRTKLAVRKKRPSTSSCILIEVPQTLLNSGLKVGDLLVTKGKETDSKTFHFFSLK